MPNVKLALEWLDFAKKSMETARLLYRENHYTDVISIDIQQAIEKALKAVYAFNGEKIPRTHSLEILFLYSEKSIEWKEIDIKNLLVISDYYQEERYPGPKYFMPEREEINESILLAETLLLQVEKFLNATK